MTVPARWKWTLGAGAALALAAFFMTRPEVIEVELHEVMPGPLTVTVDEDGITRLREHVEIAAPVSGRMLESSLQPGDSVTRGQVVARLAPAPLDARGGREAEAALAGARALREAGTARVQQAEIALDEARHDRTRAERLAEAGAIAQRELEGAIATEKMRQRDVEVSRSSAEAAAQDERRARTALLGSGPGQQDARGLVEIRTPMTGRVLRMLQEHERVIPAGTPLLEVGDPSRIEVLVDVLSADATRIVPGAAIVVRVAQGPPLAARVERVEPAAFTRLSPLGVEEQRVNVVARFRDPVTGLGDRFRVSASIQVWSADSVLAVPSTSLVPLDGGWGVFVVTDGRARLRKISTGQRSASAIEVTGGIEPGDRVVRHPDERLVDGTRVRG